MSGKLVEFYKLDDGRLQIMLTREGRDELNSDEFTYPDFDEMIEWQLCNGWEFIWPEEIGALTDAPILSDAAERDDKGVLTSVGRVYWYPQYQVHNPVEELDRHVSIYFQEVD